MVNEFFRYYKPRSLVAVLVFTGILFYAGNSIISNRLGINISIIGVIIGLLVMIDKYWWRKGWFRWLFWSIDLEGEYEGEIYFDDPLTGLETRKDAVIQIFQTGSSIKLVSTFGNGEELEYSKSKSLQASLVKDEHGHYSLVFTYRNEGNQKLNFNPHYGTNIYEVLESPSEPKRLEGFYYTNRAPKQTKGTIRVQLKSNK